MGAERTSKGQEAKLGRKATHEAEGGQRMAAPRTGMRRAPTLVRALSPKDLEQAAALFGEERDLMRARLRWYLHTPYAVVKGLYARDSLMGLGCGLQFGASAHLAHLVVSPEWEGHDERVTLASALLSEFARNGACSVSVQVSEADVRTWERQGFRAGEVFLRYLHGHAGHPSHEEVCLLQPSHVLALLHMDERATGESRRPLLLEHRFAAHAYVESGQVRGGLLPLLGSGLILAQHAQAGLELQRWLVPHQRSIVVPARNAEACANLEGSGHFAASAGVRMVLGRQPQFRPELVYAWPWAVT